MKIFVKAKPKAKQEEVLKVDENHFVVAVKEPPVGGRANEAIRKAIAQYFNVPASEVSIISGHTSRQKIVEIKVENE